MLKVLEALVRLNKLLLLERRVHGDGGEAALAKELVELDRTLHRPDKDDDLVELERVKQVAELAILLSLRQLDVVLLQPVQRELRIVHQDLYGLVHELLADGP